MSIAFLAERWPCLVVARLERLDEPHPLKKTCERQGAESARGIVGSYSERWNVPRTWEPLRSLHGSTHG